MYVYSHSRNGYCRREDVGVNLDAVWQYKVFVSYAYGERGDFPYQVIGRPFLGRPNECCSETYLMICPCDSKQVCEHIISYMATRFFRFLVLLKKNTQHATRQVYSYVPMQNFAERSDIDWSKPVPELDALLYQKYGLSPAEISFIESMVQPRSDS